MSHDYGDGCTFHDISAPPLVFVGKPVAESQPVQKPLEAGLTAKELAERILRMPFEDLGVFTDAMYAAGYERDTISYTTRGTRVEDFVKVARSIVSPSAVEDKGKRQVP